MPPARLLLIALGILAGCACYYLHGLGLGALLVVPGLAGTIDLIFERLRFERLRVPDAGIATGLFVAVLLPPTTSLVLSGTIAVVAVASKHVLRSRGRPWFNPATAGVVAGAAVFALQPAWWVVAGPHALYLGVGLGLLLMAARASPWRLTATFLVAYAAVATFLHGFLGATFDPRVLALQVVDPSTLFFAFFMVVEPRTSPADHPSQVLYAAAVGVLGAIVPLAFPTVGLLVALLLGNAFALGIRWSSPATASVASRSPHGRSSSRAARRQALPPPRWSVGRRAAAGVTVLVVLGVVAAIGVGVRGPSLPPGGGSAGTTLTGCTHDNPAIPASTLAKLHQMLGPSVIRSYNASTGVVVFYDPVNHVTVTETDLFEDYGYAEFNGDDFAVSGCAP